MGKCSKIITKSAKQDRVGKPCGIYTSKQIEDKFYCKSHYDKLISSMNEKEEVKEVVEVPKVDIKQEITPEVPEEPVENITLENGYSLEECIDAQFKKNIQNIRSKSKADLIMDKLNTIIRMLEIKQEPIKNIEELDIPTMEIFK